MEMRQLRYFLTVADTQHFGRAALRLHMAQPPLSHAIRQLERDLGFELFSRTTRSVRLTRAGAAFAHDVRSILRHLDEAVARAQAHAEGRHGTLRIGVADTATFAHLPEIARVVTRALPGVRLALRAELPTAEQEAALLEGRLDVGLVRTPLSREGLTHRLLARERLVVALPKRHRLADDPPAGVADLRGEEFVLLADPAHAIVNAAVVRSCAAAGFTPRASVEVPTVTALMVSVASGLGVALVPAGAAAMAVRGVVLLSLPGTESVDLSLAWPTKEPSPIVAALVAALEEQHRFARGVATS